MRGVVPASPPGELQAAIEDARHKVDEAKWWINAQGVGCSSRPEMVARLEWAYQRLTLALKLLRAVPAPPPSPSEAELMDAVFEIVGGDGHEGLKRGAPSIHWIRSLVVRLHGWLSHHGGRAVPAPQEGAPEPQEKL